MRTLTVVSFLALLISACSGGALPTGTATPRPSAVPTAQATPAVNLDTATWRPYTSIRYGYSIAYPTNWVLKPATIDWVAESRFELWSSNGDGSDRFINATKPPDLREHLLAMSVAVPQGTTETSWIDAFETPPVGTTPECLTTAAEMTPITIDGHAGRISTSCENPMSAFVLVDGRMYVFSVDSDDEALFRAFVSTFRLPAPSPS